MGKPKPKKVSTVTPPPPPPPKDPNDKGYRVSVDLVNDPDFTMSFEDAKTALAQINSICSRGYVINDQRDNKVNRYELFVYPLQQVRKISLYKGE